jgi:hypothetical protein
MSQSSLIALILQLHTIRSVHDWARYLIQALSAKICLTFDPRFWRSKDQRTISGLDSAGAILFQKQIQPYGHETHCPTLRQARSGRGQLPCQSLIFVSEARLQCICMRSNARNTEWGNLIDMLLEKHLQSGPPKARPNDLQYSISETCMVWQPSHRTRKLCVTILNFQIPTPAPTISTCRHRAASLAPSCEIDDSGCQPRTPGKG